VDTASRWNDKMEGLEVGKDIILYLKKSEYGYNQYIKDNENFELKGKLLEINATGITLNERGFIWFFPMRNIEGVLQKR
jgi:hypothetical protein